MKIALIFNKELEYVIAGYVERVLLDSAIEFKHFWSTDANLIKPEYDLYLRIDDSDYEHDLPHHLRPSVLWVLDAHLKKIYRKLLKMAKRYDFVFCGGWVETEKFNRKGIKAIWIPHGCDPDVHKKLNIKKRYDLGYVGRDGGNVRKFILQELGERCPNGFIGRAHYLKMSQIYSSSRIGFNDSNYIGPRGKIRNILNPRIFEIMSCGTMLLTSYVDGGSIEKLGFVNRKHLVVYHNLDEMLDLIDYYLTNDEERERIAEEGHRLVTSKHTYKHRVSEMFKCIREKLGGKYNDLRI